MKQAIIITPDISTLKEFANAIIKFCEYDMTSETHFNVVFDGDTSDNSYLSVTFFDRIDTFLEEEEKRKVIAIYPDNRHYFVIDFNIFSIFKRFILQLYKYFNFIIDNGFGYFYGKEEFLTKNDYEEFIAQRSDIYME